VPIKQAKQTAVHLNTLFQKSRHVVWRTVL